MLTDVKKIIKPKYVYIIPIPICTNFFFGNFRQIPWIIKKKITTIPNAIVTSLVTLNKFAPINDNRLLLNEKSYGT